MNNFKLTLPFSASSKSFDAKKPSKSLDNKGSVKEAAFPNLDSNACATSSSTTTALQLISSLELKHHLSDDRKSVLTLDLRSSSEYNKAHIINSVNINVPKLMLKRDNVKLEKIRQFITNTENRKLFDNCLVVDNLIIVDDNNKKQTINETMALFAGKFNRQKIMILKGDTKEFLEENSQFTEKFEQSYSQQSPRSNSLVLPNNKKDYYNTGPLTCPLSLIQDFENTQLYKSVMQYNLVVSPSEENIKLDIPQNLITQNSSPTNSTQIPVFLKCGLDDLKQQKIKHEFTQLQKDEKNRIKILLASQQHNAQTSCKYSIKAAIEKGTKNRYNNIWPFDYNRLKLNIPINDLDDNQGLDYINASLIYEKNSNNSYIATQGPLKSTCEDFWQLIYQQNTKIIVMLTKLVENGRERCHEYWPSTEKTTLLISTKLSVTLLNQTTLNSSKDIILRKLLLRDLSNNSKPTVVFQLHYIGWPDYGAPENHYDIIHLQYIYSAIIEKLEYEKTQYGPSVIHCSAGCGRTGTFILIDSIINLLHDKATTQNKTVEDDSLIYKIVDELRDQRINMVQTLKQYMFCYETLIHKSLNSKNQIMNNMHQDKEIIQSLSFNYNAEEIDFDNFVTDNSSLNPSQSSRKNSYFELH